MSRPALLQARGLVVKRDGSPVLRGVDLDLFDGEVTALVGPNGAGKSTLIAALAGLVPRSEGSVTLNGSLASALQSPGLARRSARANVEAALGWWGTPRRERRTRATEALATMSATHLSSRRATLLSGGEQRRVHLARALALDPDILLLDEPFAGLDPETKGTLLEDTTSVLRNRRGATLVVVHDRAEAWALADRIVVLMDGVVAGSGRGQDLLEHPPTAAVARFLGFDGELVRGGTLTLTRARHITIHPAQIGDARIDSAGRAIVDRVIPVEDGYRVRLKLDAGVVTALVTGAPPAVGDTVEVRVAGGATFAALPPATE
jgi:ABC-type sulfate/molybdate transport systems ATPase subunit